MSEHEGGIGNGKDEPTLDEWVDHRATPEEMDAASKKVWEDFWLPLFMRDDEVEKTIPPFSPFLEAVQAELFDYHQMMRNTTLAFCDVSGYMISKPMTYYGHVVDAAQEHYRKYALVDVLEFIDGYEELPQHDLDKLRAAFIKEFGDPGAD